MSPPSCYNADMDINPTPAAESGEEAVLIQRLTGWARTGLDEALCDALVPSAASGSATIREILAHPEIVARKPDVDGTRLIVRYRLKVDVSATASHTEIAADEAIRNFFGGIGDGSSPDDLITCDSTLVIAIEVPLHHRSGAQPPEDIILVGPEVILAGSGTDVSPR